MLRDSANWISKQFNNKPQTDVLYMILKNKLESQDFRIISGSKCLEIQDCNFIADKDWVVREPNYDYAKREIEWYEKQSLYVDDIPGKTPAIWEQCADKDGKINSNYGWCIWSNENGNQYKNCLNTLIKDNHSRQAVMLYIRPSMYKDAFENDRHDFMCTYSVQCFLNEVSEDTFSLKYIVYMRSNDCVFGYCNDVLFHRYVQESLRLYPGSSPWQSQPYFCPL